MKWDILGLPASQIKETGSEILQCGHTLFTSGNDTSQTNGVSFLVHKSILSFISAFQLISDRLVTL